MKILAFSVLLALSCISGFSQNLIGYNSDDIQKYMKEKHAEMNFNKVVNSKFSYLKYTDNDEMQTILFFLNDKAVCNSIRIVCDSNLKTSKIREFNSEYTKKGENMWIDKREDKSFLVLLKDEKWACTITIEPEK
jgi:hypothetical protein